MKYREIEERIRVWAEEATAVRTLVAIGSRARKDRPADILSDLDLILFVVDPQALAQDGSWLDSFGEVRLKYL